MPISFAAARNPFRMGPHDASSHADASADGASEGEMAQIVLGIDPGHGAGARSTNSTAISLARVG